MEYPIREMENTPHAASPAILFAEVAALTYSHAPPQSGFDLSDVQRAKPSGDGTIPYSMPDPAFDQHDPLGGFLAQSESRGIKTEAERIGADRFGYAWPMLRAQRLHSGDGHVTDAIMRATYAHSRIGSLFTPLEIPQNPDGLYRADDPSGRRRRG